LPLKVAAGTSRPQGRQQQRRSVAVVDAANPQSNFFLPAPGAEKLASSLEAGEFLLLTAHRQAGKTTLAQEIVVQLQERGCLTAVIYLTMLPEKKSLSVLHEILKILEIPDSRDDPKWCVYYPPARRRDFHTYPQSPTGLSSPFSSLHHHLKLSLFLKNAMQCSLQIQRTSYSSFRLCEN